jgi:hypothetical protein
MSDCIGLRPTKLQVGRLAVRLCHVGCGVRVQGRWQLRRGIVEIVGIVGMSSSDADSPAHSGQSQNQGYYAISKKQYHKKVSYAPIDKLVERRC